MQSSNILELARERVVVFDGAMGSMLMDAGLPPGGIPELWNLEKPEIIMDIHKRYYDAGADVIHTNTFGGTSLKLNVKGHADKMDAVNAAAVAIAKRARSEKGLIAGDMGPTGQMLKPMGNATLAELEDAFFLQAESLIKAGVDLISIETMFSLEEALAAVRSAKKAGACPVIGGITYNKSPNGFFTMMGESVEQCASALEEAGADVIASNCTLGSRDMIALAETIREATLKPILIQPNAGKPALKEGVTVYEQTAAEFGLDIEKIIDSGADMVGGCCGTNPDFIREIVKYVNAPPSREIE